MNWRPYAIGAAACACSLAVGLYAGRSQTPDTVETSHEQVAVTIQQHSKTRYVREEQATRIVYRERVTKPDGTITERESERTDTHVKENGGTDSSETQTAKRETETYKQVTASEPQWRIGALIGAQLQSPLLPIAGPLVVGVNVERRIAGPFWLGVWGISGGAAGASISITF